MVQLGSRALFPQLQARAYCNHAAVSPASTRVMRAVTGVLAEYAQHGLDAIFPFFEQRESLKDDLRTLLGVEGPIAITASTNRGLSDAALSLPWQPGDRVLLFEGEFPANVTPWVQAAKAFGAEVTFLSLDATLPELLEEARRELAKGKVRVLAVSAVQFQTGRRMPIDQLADLCHQHGALIAVDAIQAVGVVPFSGAKLDLIAGGAHKWLMGMEGVGYLWARPGLELVPRVSGWLSHAEPVDFLMEGAGKLRYDKPIRSEIDFLEIGSTNVAGCVALQAAIAPILELGVPAIFEHVQAWHDRVEPALVERGFTSLRRGPGERSGSLTVSHPDAMELGIQLNEAGVACTTPDGVLRLAPHWPNALDEVDVLTAALS
ncbi:MAG: aminotransferase class V-fold PLP-dependent enzyme [Proteobacteria bacterium]|nr:aminotransferase class V-fold PLP-dependent enzyme [Pseudomonadota bacterium]